MSVVLNSPRRLPEATITEDNDIRYLHLGTSWIQGAMRLNDPDAIALEYVQQMMIWMLFEEAPERIVQLGLGSGALTKFCHRHFPEAYVNAIDINPSVIETCRKHFCLPDDNAHLRVQEMDAMAFLENAANRQAIDILQVDLYDEFAQGPVFDSPAFYRQCASCLKPGGIMTTNIFGNEESYEKSLYGMLLAFDAVAWLPRVDDENLIAIGFTQSPSVDFAVLRERAARIQTQTRLQTESWIDGLEEWMRSA